MGGVRCTTCMTQNIHDNDRNSTEIELNGEREGFEYFVEQEDWIEALEFVDRTEITEFRMAAGTAPGFGEYDNRFKVHIYDLAGNFVVYYDGPTLCEYQKVEAQNIENDGFVGTIAEGLEDFARFSVEEKGNSFEESVEVEVDEIGISQEVVDKLENFVLDDEEPEKFICAWTGDELFVAEKPRDLEAEYPIKATCVEEVESQYVVFEGIFTGPEEYDVTSDVDTFNTRTEAELVAKSLVAGDEQ